MHELVLVLSDFYVSQEAHDRELPVGVTLPGFQHVTRFGTRWRLPNGWRPWLSRWLIGTDAGATATVAAALRRSDALNGPAVASGTVAWMATPMHLLAGMTSVHVDRCCILRLVVGVLVLLATDFQRVFHDSGFHLQPLGAGDFLMLGPEMPLPDVEEPARALGGSMGQHADRSIALRRLGAEIEMWLHDHPVNDTRRRRGEIPVTSLWLWGAGAVTGHGDVGGTAAEHVPAAGSRAAPHRVAASNVGGAAAEHVPAAGSRAAPHRVAASDVGSAAAGHVLAAGAHSGAPALPPDNVGINDSGTSDHLTRAVVAGNSSGAADGALAFGRDSYLEGLWARCGASAARLPQQLADVFGYPHAQRAVLVIEIGVMLQSNPRWTFFEAVADIDRRFIAPAVEALNRGQYQRLVVLANDYELRLRASDRLKFWRRAPPGLSGLQ